MNKTFATSVLMISSLIGAVKRQSDCDIMEFSQLEQVSDDLTAYDQYLEKFEKKYGLEDRKFASLQLSFAIYISQ